VRRRAPGVEETRLREDEGAGADRRHRRDRFAARRTQATTRSSPAARRVPAPPAMTSVSIEPRAAAIAAAGTTRIPFDMKNGSGSGATTSTA
jgi:hypothetical protein